MRKLAIIGVGPGSAELVTVQAATALAEVDAFILLDKGPDKSDLRAARLAILERYARAGRYRLIEVDDPVRDPTADYLDAVQAWHTERAERLEQVLAEHVDDHECAAILVWGDPSLYDSTLRLVERLQDRARVPFVYEVVPGISSVQLLAARHRTTLHRVGGAVHITTGRNLRAEGPGGRDDIVVMLDASNAFVSLVGEPWDILWGAYLGTPNELLIAGRLAEVSEEIIRTRAEARERHGWIFDIYLLRRAPWHGAG